MAKNESGAKTARSLEAYSTALSSRLRLLLTKHSQAEIARKTGTLPSNVNNYLKGTRVPAEFCHALVREFGINPAWLIAGEGTPYLADVSAATGGLASNMLELVQAMNSVTKMRLGALADKGHARTLGQLNEHLKTYERLKKELDKHSSPVLEQLLDEMSDALFSKVNMEAAAHIRDAAGQVNRLCEDPVLRRRFLKLKGYHDYICGRNGEAVAAQRKVFLYTLADSSAEFDEACDLASDLIQTLYSFARLDEARRVCDAALALSSSRPEGKGYLEVLGLRCVIDAGLGDIQRGLGQLITLFPKFPADFQKRFGSLYTQMLLMAGGWSFERAESITPHTQAKSEILLWFACWLEDAGTLKRAIERYVGDEGHQVVAGKGRAHHASCLLAALEGRHGKPIATYRKGVNLTELASKTHPVFASFITAVNCCQIAKAGGEKKQAVEFLIAAEQSHQSYPPELARHILNTGIHYRNALELIPEKSGSAKLKALRVRAQQFFDEHYKKGYGCFARHASASLHA